MCLPGRVVWWGRLLRERPDPTSQHQAIASRHAIRYAQHMSTEPDDEIDFPVVCPCGCRLLAPVDGTVVLRPCANDCPSVDVIAGLFIEAGKSVEHREAPHE